MTETFTDVLVTDADGVREIVFNRPAKKNAFTAAMYAALATALREASASEAVGAVLLHGAGGVFTAGNDIGDFLAAPPIGPDAPVLRFLAALVDSDKPLVAAVEGPAVGVGTTMLLHCDLVFAAPEARFRTPFVDLGLVPEAASSVLLPALVGPVRANRMLLAGEAIDAATARDWGLVGTVCAPGTVVDDARAAAQALARKPRGAVAGTRALMRPDRAHLHAVMKREFALFGERLKSDEAKAAFAAFLKR
ncbi:enoyl-CoA hydratase-related protein [Alsobacter sp. R-9]